MVEVLEVDTRGALGVEVEWVRFRPEARGVDSDGDSSGMVEIVEVVEGIGLWIRESNKRRPLVVVVGVRDPRLLTGSRGDRDIELFGVTGSGGSLDRLGRADVGVGVVAAPLPRRSDRKWWNWFSGVWGECKICWISCETTLPRRLVEVPLCVRVSSNRDWQLLASVVRRRTD